MDAKQVPLRELLASVPADARLVIDDADGKGTRFIPVGRLCQEAAAALAEPVEPVAKVELMMTGGNAGLATRIVEIDDHLRERLRPGQLLYTAPPQRKPLSKEEMMNEFCKTPGIHQFVSAFFAGARYAERAHGIKEGT